MPETPKNNETRAALRASLAQIETSARLAQQAIDKGQPASVLGRCLDDVDRSFAAFDRARVELNKQQVNALENWENFGQEKQNAEEVIEEWLGERRNGQRNGQRGELDS